MDLRLTSEQELIRASAREFAEREIAPHAARLGPRRGGRPGHREEARRGSASSGLTVDEEYGGCGGDHSRTAWSPRSSARRTPPCAGSSPSRSGWSPRRSRAWGTEEQKRAGCPGSRPAKHSAASASPSPVPAPTPATSPRARCGTATTMSSTAPRCSSRNGTWAESCSLFARTSDGRPQGRLRLPRAHRHAAASTRRTDPRQARAARPGHRRTGPRGRARARLRLLGARGQGLLGRHVGARQGPDVGRGGLRRHRPGRLDAAVAYAGEREQFGRPIARTSSCRS